MCVCVCVCMHVHVHMRVGLACQFCAGNVLEVFFMSLLYNCLCVCLLINLVCDDIFACMGASVIM